MDRLVDPLACAARLLLAALFIHEGWQKIGAYADIAGYMQAHGVPGQLLPLVILTELGGGLLVAVGLATRASAFALAGFCVLAALIFHAASGDGEQLIQLEKNIAIAGGFLALTAFGAGRWSLDAWLAGVLGSGKRRAD